MKTFFSCDEALIHIVDRMFKQHPKWLIDRVPQLGPKAACMKQAIRDKLIEHKQYIAKYGEDLPEIRKLLAFAHLLCEFNQLRDDLRRFNRPVLVFANGGFQLFGEGAGLSERFLRTDFQFVVQQLLQQLDGEIALLTKTRP